MSMSSDQATTIIRQEHHALSSVLQSMSLMLRRGPDDDAERFFDVVRAMLFYIDEFPERLHHVAESTWLFPPLLRAAPELKTVIDRLQADHTRGENRVRQLQHLLAGWELLGESRRGAFEAAAVEYVQFYLEHMRVEETQLLPAAERLLTEDDWVRLSAAFSAHRDPLAGGTRGPGYDRLFSRIVMRAPAPIGLGSSN